MVYLDANVVLELIIPGRPHLDDVTQYLKQVEGSTAISMLTVHLVMHFGRKAGVSDEFLLGFINQSELIELTPEDFLWAVRNEKRRDFEDALQLAPAIRRGFNSFVTLEKKLYKSYSDCPIEIICLG